MSVLNVDGVPVAEVEVARSFAARGKGLLGRDGLGTGLVLEPASSVHTFGMRFAIDVAYVARDGLVLAVTTMPPQRLGLPRPRARWVLETEAERLTAWGIRPGRRLSLTSGGSPSSGKPSSPRWKDAGRRSGARRRGGEGSPAIHAVVTVGLAGDASAGTAAGAAPAGDGIPPEISNPSWGRGTNPTQSDG